MRLIYADGAIAVVEKGFGEISECPQVPEPGAEYTPLLLKDALLARETPCDEIYTVHRLDRTTAGLMVYALTRDAAASLSAQLGDGRFRKEYLAAIHGTTPVENAGEMGDFLYYDRGRGKSFVVKKKRPGAKEALLRWRLTDTLSTRWGEVVLARVELLTGRTHQIRVQFGSRGLPLLGDGKYGSRANYKGCALYSAALNFVHPATGEPMGFDLSDGIHWEFQECDK